MCDKPMLQASVCQNTSAIRSAVSIQRRRLVTDRQTDTGPSHVPRWHTVERLLLLT